MTSRRIALHDGTLQMHCVTWGAPSAPPIVMLHGLRAYGQWFEEFAEAAATDFYLIAPDQRGRGSTDWANDARYDTDSYVADLLQLADNWPLQRFAIIGHSMGGTNAINFAARYPERVSALVIIDSSPELNPLGLGRIARETSAMPPSFDSEAAARSYLRAYMWALPSEASARALPAHSLSRLAASFGDSIPPFFRLSRILRSDHGPRWRRSNVPPSSFVPATPTL